MNQRDRIAAVLQAMKAPSAVFELRDGQPDAPDAMWRKAALGFVATVAVATSSAVLLSSNTPSPTKNTPSIQVPAVAADSAQVARGLPPITMVVEKERVQAISPMDRVRLCKVAAAQFNLKGHGLDWRDIYAFVHAETGWLARDGMGRNGKVSRGLAQLEDATARSLGIADANDPRQALEAVAQLLKEAANWRRAKGYGKDSGALSVYYNLSTKARNQWDGESVETLPVETQRHIANTGQGRLFASHLERLWTSEQKKLALQFAPYKSRRMASDGDGQNQRMAGFAGSVQVAADTTNDRQMVKLARQAADRAGVRPSELGLNQLRGNIAELIDRIKAGSQALVAQASTTVLSDREKRLASNSFPGLTRLMGPSPVADLIQYAKDRGGQVSVAQGKVMSPEQRQAVVAELGKQEGATVYELRRLSDRNLAFSGYLDQVAENQQQILDNAARQRRG